MKYILFALALGSLGACATTSYTRVEAPALFNALDAQPNGWIETDETSIPFQILSTRTNGTLLCRTISLQAKKIAKQKEFCKIKGGEWR